MATNCLTFGRVACSIRYMKRLFPALLVVLALSSCLSRNYRIVAAQGTQQDACVSLPSAELMKSDGYYRPLVTPASPNMRLMRAGDAYYLEGIKAKVKRHYEFPQQCIVWMGCNGKNPRKSIAETGARVWRRVVVKNGRYVGLAEGSEWVAQFPVGARPVVVKGHVGESADVYGEEELTLHALYACPLAAATAVCIDLPCTVVGSVLVGGVLGGVAACAAVEKLVSPAERNESPVSVEGVSENQTES